MRRLIFLIVPCVLLIVGVGAASAGPSPDGQQTTSASPQQILLTPYFALGEVDLSSLGVTPTALLTVGIQLSSSTSSADSMLIVDNDGLNCPNAQYSSIQAAVTAAMPGDTIKVCPGTYMEQVTIPAGKDGLTLFSEGDLQAVIKAPLVMAPPEAIVRVNGAHDVTIRHFTITGPGGGPCNSIRYGVFVDNGGSALITDNHITEIRDTPPLSGCQNGRGVGVGRQPADDGPTTGSATVVHNLIDKYQKSGVAVDNVGSSAEVAYNEVVGSGPTAAIAQNGVQVTRGAEANVHHNKVSQNFYSLPGTEAAGILLLSNGTARAHHNDVFLNQDGIAVFDDVATAEVSYNNSRNNFDGIYAYEGTSDNLIAYNKAFENTHLDCRDDNPPPTTNNWLKDLGRTENQPGLCKQAGPQ